MAQQSFGCSGPPPAQPAFPKLHTPGPVFLIPTHTRPTPCVSQRNEAARARPQLGAALLVRMRGFLEAFLEGGYCILMGQVNANLVLEHNWWACGAPGGLSGGVFCILMGQVGRAVV